MSESVYYNHGDGLQQKYAMAINGNGQRFAAVGDPFAGVVSVFDNGKKYQLSYRDFQSLIYDRIVPMFQQALSITGSPLSLLVPPSSSPPPRSNVLPISATEDTTPSFSKGSSSKPQRGSVSSPNPKTGLKRSSSKPQRGSVSSPNPKTGRKRSSSKPQHGSVSSPNPKTGRKRSSQNHQTTKHYE